MSICAENTRLQEDLVRSKNWKRWGPYLSERQWGTVREDYSADGSCWDHFPHDHARSRAYRWGEDGLFGITDRQCRLCLSLVLWNGKDPILKERLFGLTGPEGNHGEDCKECYYYLDATPTYSYAKALYKYPQTAYPYNQLTEENRNRSRDLPEFELENTGIFDENRYFDVFVEMAKHSPNNMVIRYTIVNRGPDTASLHVMPQLWFRNTWIWGCKHEGCSAKPNIRNIGDFKFQCTHETLGQFYFEVKPASTRKVLPELLITENETNTVRLYGCENFTPYAKDAFHRYIIHGEKTAVKPKTFGTKIGAVYKLNLKPGETSHITCCFYEFSEASNIDIENLFDQRLREANEFYNKKLPVSEVDYNIGRQAYAGLLWSKQFYHYGIREWLEGDPEMPCPPCQRLAGRNHDWKHLFNRDVVSMPDKWEYPWYASWDLAFHMIPFAEIDIEFAKQQLLLFLREWYMHPNGQIPAYEFALGDVNPPVHAWACWRVYKLTRDRGKPDRVFLARCFQKLILNFTWWVNRKDPDGNNIFAGGFLGLDNIGVFDRSKPLPENAQLEQADGTAWVAFFCAHMLEIALELAEHDPVYEDMASKFFEHFISIADAINSFDRGSGLWNPEDGFYYDHLKQRGNGESRPLRIRSMVGLVPLFSCLVLERSGVRKLEAFHKRTDWFMKNRRDLMSKISFMTRGTEERLLLAIPTKDQLISLLRVMLDENEFLSPYGIRSLSKAHELRPFKLHLGGEDHSVSYVPGESNTHLFGGNSNWRGPIWLCVNYLIIYSLRRYDYFYGDGLRVEFPTASGNFLRLRDVAVELADRICCLFRPDDNGYRPCHGHAERYRSDPFWNDLILFYEYFNGDNGAGCGASHQTGWTALVVNCLKLLYDT